LADPARHAHRGERLCRAQAVEVSKTTKPERREAATTPTLKPTGSVCRSTFAVTSNGRLYEAAVLCDGLRRIVCCSVSSPIE
jgi:hypothetical protein